MALFGAGLDIGLALLLAVAFIKYVGIKVESSRPQNLLAAGAIFFILAGVIGGATLGFSLPTALDMILNTIGALAVAAGAIWLVYLLVIAKK